MVDLYCVLIDYGWSDTYFVTYKRLILTHGVLSHAGHVGRPVAHGERLRHPGVGAGSHLDTVQVCC